jgi:CheY-like chemotaxis protein
MAEQSILIVDDNPVNLKLIRILLTGEGYDVHTANDAGSYPRIAGAAVADDSNGQLNESGATARDIMIFGLTAYAMKGDEEKMLAAGCDGYIAKPIDTRTLPGVIQGYLEL